MVPAVSPRISRVLGYSGVHSASVGFRLRGCHPLWLRFPSHSANFRACLCYGSFYPAAAVTAPVWALPRSLATTCGIIVIFFSCGYLDVSVPRVGNFSQLITSFLASESLGILHAPFLTFFRPTVVSDRLSFWVDMGLLRARVLFFPTCQGSFLWRITDSNR